MKVKRKILSGLLEILITSDFLCIDMMDYFYFYLYIYTFSKSFAISILCFTLKIIKFYNCKIQTLLC